jgi:hypothetical protein
LANGARLAAQRALRQRMTPEQYRRLNELFEKAMQFPIEEREEAARRSCEDDPAMLAKLLDLLRSARSRPILSTIQWCAWSRVNIAPPFPREKYYSTVFELFGFWDTVAWGKFTRRKISKPGASH